MPLYTYQCRICDKIQELQETIASRDIPMADCDCGGSLKRLIDAPGAVYAPTSKRGLAT